MSIEMTTMTQINYHLQTGEYVHFKLWRGFGFIKQVDDDESHILYKYKDKLDKNKMIMIIQPNKGYPYDVKLGRGKTVLDKVERFLKWGVRFTINTDYTLHEVRKES